MSRATGIDVRRFSWSRSLAADYATNYAAVASFYSGDPSSSDAWRQAITRAQQHGRRRADVVAVLAAQQAQRDAPTPARDAAARLNDAAAVAMVTGQQAGVFGGPLYVLLKAITAIQMARRVREAQRVPVVPIFWVADEDHDWDEVRGVTVLNAEGAPTTIQLEPPDGAGRLPVAELRLDERVTASLDALQAALPQTDFTEWTMAALRAAWRPGETAGRAFARWIEGLLGPHGLVVFEGSDPAAKPLVADLFARELQFPGKTSALAAEAGRALADAGHQPQVVVQAENTALFHLAGGRTAIRHTEDGFAARAAEAVEHPERFSPNVLLRPVAQDALFPTICYVAGPGELAYFGQLRGIYEHFGVPMPLVYPRASATLIDAATARFLEKSQLPIEELQPQDESALNRLLEAQLPKEVDDALNAATTAARETMERVIAAMPSVDATLAGAAKTTLGKMEHDLKTLHGKVIQAAKKRDETFRRQFTRAQQQIFPTGQPQERTLGVVFFLNRYGGALVDVLLEELPLETGRHWLITV